MWWPFVHELRTSDEISTDDEDAASTRSDLGVTLRTRQSETGIPKVSAINPLLLAGLDRYCYHGFNKEAFIFAVDMPEIGELDRIKLATLENTINIYAQDLTTEGLYGERDNEVKREYDCYFRVNLQEFDPSLTEYEMVHGVLWIRVPRRVKPPIELVTLFQGAREQEKLCSQ